VKKDWRIEGVVSKKDATKSFAHSSSSIRTVSHIFYLPLLSFILVFSRSRIIFPHESPHVLGFPSRAYQRRIPTAIGIHAKMRKAGGERLSARIISGLWFGLPRDT
jgi:hypothetical protein